MSVPSEPVYQPLDEDTYWRLIDEARDGAASDSEQVKRLTEALEQLSPADILGFSFRTSVLLRESYLGDLWCAAYIMNGGCSDDGFDYFRAWVIAQGKSVFERAKADPDSLIAVAHLDMDEYELEMLLGAPYWAFEAVTGEKPWPYMDHAKFRAIAGEMPAVAFSWSDEDEASMERICPQLYEKFQLI